jgi:hypothetical protein
LLRARLLSVLWRLAALPWRRVVPLRSAASERRPEQAGAERERVLPAWERPVAEVAVARGVVSFLRHHRRPPVHPETEDQNSQTRHQEMVVPAVRLRMLLESAARLLVEDRLRFATAQAIITPRMETDQQVHLQLLRHCHLLAATNSLDLDSKGSDLRPVSHRVPPLSLPRPQFDPASAVMLAQVPITQLRSLRLPEARWEHPHHRPRFRALH